MNWCMCTHTHTRARARAGGGGGGGAQAHMYMHISKQNLSISLPSSLSLSLTSPISILLFLCRARTLSRARMLRRMHEWKLALFRFSEVTVCWLCFFSPLTDSATISFCKRVALLTGNVFFFTMPYLSLIILIIIDCRCQCSSFFSFSFLVLLKVFVNGGNETTIFSPWQHVQWLQKVLKGKLRKQLWHVFLFSPWVRRTTLKSVYITTVFFFLKQYFFGFLLCIKTITPDQRHFVLVTFLLVSIFLCLFLTLLICFATWCPSLHQCVFSSLLLFFLETSAQAIFISIFDFCCNFVFRFCFFFSSTFFCWWLFSRMLFKFLSCEVIAHLGETK